MRVPEHLLDAVTGLSGSGPAYVFLVAEALVEAGVLVGLPRPTAEALVRQTLLGSARLLAESGEAAEALRAGVTSPGGTTAAGLRELERHGVRAALLDAVDGGHRAVEAARPLNPSSPFRHTSHSCYRARQRRKGCSMAQNQARPQLLTVSEVAEMLRVST